MMYVIRQLPTLLTCLAAMFAIPGQGSAYAQFRREEIHTDYVLYQKRALLEKDLRERIIARTFSMPLDSNSEDRYLSACWAIGQFLFHSPETDRGFHALFAGYDSLTYDTQRAFLEALYAVAPQNYITDVQTLLDKEARPTLFVLCALYLYRSEPTTENGNALKIRMVEKFPGYDSLPLLQELEQYLTYHSTFVHGKTPDIPALFKYHSLAGQKIIYSFQRWDRDYPGLAIVMDERGHFVRDGDGRLQVFRQLARSGPDLPYFITNGSTPQGIYRIRGTDVSRTNFIGPTPNLQMIMPFENRWDRFFGADTLRNMQDQDRAPDDQRLRPIDSLLMYRALLPPGWRDYTPMMEAWTAGRIGRTEIIAHGTTIDPEFFRDRPFYPLTPTMGCLCAKELWNPTTGHLLVSEQLNLVNAFLSTPGRKGYVVVVNVDDRHSPVSREEVEAWVRKAENR